MENTNGSGVTAISSLLHAGYSNDVLRDWQTIGTELSPANFVLPIFVTDEASGETAISSMPGVSRYSVPALQERLQQWCSDGLKSVLLFGVVPESVKNAEGSVGKSLSNPVIPAIQMIRKNYPYLTVICDVCMCEYTDHGHCGILDASLNMMNTESTQAIAEQALAYARAGAQVVAPSDMNDGRIGRIKQVLQENGFGSSVAVLSYSCKFTSSLYGPFRDAANSAPSHGDRRKYQLPPGSVSLALRAADRDVKEGADMLMVKPAGPYLHVVCKVKERHSALPMFIYHVSGEFATDMMREAAGADIKKYLMQDLYPNFRAAGADVIISYHTPRVLKWIKEARQAEYHRS